MQSYCRIFHNGVDLGVRDRLVLKLCSETSGDYISTLRVPRAIWSLAYLKRKDTQCRGECRTSEWEPKIVTENPIAGYVSITRLLFRYLRGVFQSAMPSTNKIVHDKLTASFDQSIRLILWIGCHGLSSHRYVINISSRSKLWHCF